MTEIQAKYEDLELKLRAALLILRQGKNAAEYD